LLAAPTLTSVKRKHPEIDREVPEKASVLAAIFTADWQRRGLPISGGQYRMFLRQLVATFGNQGQQDEFLTALVGMQFSQKSNT
jgi:hypothetical protein